MNGPSDRVLRGTTLVVTAVGAVLTIIEREWDLLLVLALALLLQLALWFRHRAARETVSLRPDLARWLEQRTRRTGEGFDDALDRAVASARDGLFVPDRTDATTG